VSRVMKLVRKHLACLAYAVCAVCGLCFHRGIPPGIIMNDIVRSGQVQPGPPGPETDQERPDTFVGLEPVDVLLPVDGPSVKVFVDDTLPVQMAAQDASA